MIYSVIIPVYNAERYLLACLDSVLAQDTPSEYEVILVDDGSTDRSGAICDEYAAAHPQFRALHTENQWQSAARNHGLRAARGPLCFSSLCNQHHLRRSVHTGNHLCFLLFHDRILLLSGPKSLDDEGRG